MESTTGASEMSSMNPEYKIEDGGVWIADMWHGDTGEVIGWHRLADIAYCVHGDGHIATNVVSLFNAEDDNLIGEFATCATHAARKVFGHRDDQYAVNRGLHCPGYVPEMAS
jgi:hypothetical protein